LEETSVEMGSKVNDGFVRIADIGINALKQAL
jgi:hypothetical protein